VSEPAELFEVHRTALFGHCYRMLGGASDADDAVQETMIRAWKSFHTFDRRASLSSWLYRIATNVCLDALSGRSKRVRSVDLGPAADPRNAPLDKQPSEHWLAPIPDRLALPADARLELRESVRMAFVAALQHLPPKQRAALLLIDVLGFSASEAAGCLNMSEASVNIALQRARAAVANNGGLSARPSDSFSEQQTQLLQRYVDAFERYDVDQLVALLHQDAAFSMPPYSLWLQGPEAIRCWLLGTGIGCRGSRLLPAGTACGGAPAFGQYRIDLEEGGHAPWALAVLDLDQSGTIAGWTSYLDTGRLFPLFGLPPHLP
jgi:RNA polymerase sigma-70 factor, ECF subfamily